MAHASPFCGMECIEGESLDSRIRGGDVSIGQALVWMEQMADAVSYLHGQEVRHRDIKPANLIIDKKGNIKLVDFGLATETGVTEITREGIHFGTVSYAPPEWIDPSQLDPVQWDLYAIGVVFFELLTGKRAFPTSGQGPPRKQALQVIVGKQTSPPLDPGPQFPDDLRAIVRKLTHRDPDSRPAAASEVVEGIREVKTLLASGKWHPPDEAALITAEASVITAKPAPTRKNDEGSRSSEPQPAPKPVVGPGQAPEFVVAPSNTRRVLSIIGVLLIVGGLAFALTRGDGPGPDTRDVDVHVEGLPTVVPAEITIDGKGPSGSEGQIIHFTEIPIGPADLRWAVGEGCPLERCPGEACSVGCGSGIEALDIVAGEGAQGVDLQVNVPLWKVVINVPSVQDLKFRFKKRWNLRMSLDGTYGGIVDGKGIFNDVMPGVHEVIAFIGTCNAAAAGCWPDGACPQGCRSESIDIEVEWIDGDAILSIAVPIPD
jgi:hypothetical protein